MRWKKSAAVLACAGVAAGLLLTGCTGGEAPTGNQNDATTTVYTDTPNYVMYTPTQQDLVFRSHHGGGGAAIYVVYLTEQETLGIIRRQLEEAGLRFGAAPPDYSVELIETWDESFAHEKIGISLYDGVRDVGVVNIPPFFDGDRNGWIRWHETIAQDFAELSTDTTIGVFHMPGNRTNHGWRWCEETEDGTFNDPDCEESIAAAKIEARPILEANISEQVREFVATLREQGVLE
jgi:hypothetical protein